MATTQEQHVHAQEVWAQRSPNTLKACLDACSHLTMSNCVLMDDCSPQMTLVEAAFNHPQDVCFAGVAFYFLTVSVLLYIPKYLLSNQGYKLSTVPATVDLLQFIGQCVAFGNCKSSRDCTACLVTAACRWPKQQT